MNAAPRSSSDFTASSFTPEPAQVDWLAAYPPPRSLPLDREALRIYEHAYALGLIVEEEGTPCITFSTVVAALLTGVDEASRWFAGLAEKYGPLSAAVFAEKQTTEEVVESARPTQPGKPTDLRFSSDKQLLTASARSVLGNAESWAQKVRASEIGVRHLIAAYVLNPPAAHRSQMTKKWQYQETPWREAFFQWVAARYTAEQWADASSRPAPAQAIPEIERVEVKGEALAFSGDEHAQAVLARAAELHATRPDPWLRVQTLWHALIDLRNDADVAESLAPLAAAAQKADAQYSRARSEYFASPSGRPFVPFDGLDISPRVLNALETARGLAVATKKLGDVQAPLVSVLHLAGALVSRRVDCDPELASFGFDAESLRAQMIEHAESLGESADVWRDGLGAQETAEAGRPLDLNSDEPEAVVRGDATWTDDPLQIRRDVETFGSLLASKSLEPPLSIGLFGPWGSGKTTFLKRLRLAVERRAAEAQAAVHEGKATPYVRHVVHVDFNAWHYSEGALTSSLVDTILRKLGDFITDKQPASGKEWERRKVEKLESTKRKVEAAEAVVAAATNEVTKAEVLLAGTQRAAAEATKSLGTAARAVWDGVVASFSASDEVRKSGVLDVLGTTVASSEELRSRVEALQRRPARMLRELGWPGTIFFAVLILGVPVAVAWAMQRFLSTTQAASVIATITAALSIIGVWARAASGAVAKLDAAATKVAEEYDRRMATDPGVIAAQTVVIDAQARASTAQTALQAAREELARAQSDVASAAVPMQMLQLVTSRLDAQSYNRELTTTSLARADLEAMSALLRDQRSQSPSTAQSGNGESNGNGNGNAPAAAADATPKPVLKDVERVILYIDDLDRCKPQDVVRVLQIVHMLLAFELFVVVVAVDARWVEESLRQNYTWLARNENGVARAVDGADGDAPAEQQGGRARAEEFTSRITPQDYLEKIFQIVFWLTPMSAQHAALYLKSLVRGQPRDPGAAAAAALRADDGSSSGGVEIEATELDYMRYLAAYVGSSPRRVKRLVNAYRLIKASLTDLQLRTFLTRPAADAGGRALSGPYQLVIGLLVIGTGVPASAAQIFRDLVACESSATPDIVVERFRGVNHPDWAMAAQVIETVMRTQKAKDVRELRNWALKVGRFLLNSPLDDASRTVQWEVS